MLIRFAYLAILWIFVLSAISVVRSDMFGARVDSTPRADRRGPRQAARPVHRQVERNGKPPRRPRSAPTHVAVVDGANAGETVPLDEAPILIGRGADAAIRLDDQFRLPASRRIASSGEQWFVEDLGST